MRRETTAKLLVLCGALALGGMTCRGDRGPPIDPLMQGKQRDLLVRGFLVRGEEDRRFGYHAYLVFSENSEATRAKREAAVRAFSNLMQDVRELSPTELEKLELAVLYAPVRRGGLGPQAKPEEILEAYDYVFGQWVTAQLARYRSVPQVYLLGSRVPIRQALWAGGADLWVVELKGDQRAIESTITGFRDRLLNPDKPFSGREMLERVLGFFDSVGGFVIAITTLGGDTSPSKP